MSSIDPAQNPKREERETQDRIVPVSSRALPSEARPYEGTRPYEEDEISLVDLFIVLIKHRKVVVGLPLLTALVVGTVLFVLPALGIVSFQTYTLQAIMTSVQLSPALRDQIGLDLVGLTVSYGTEFHTVLDAVAKNNLRLDGDGQDPQDIKFRTYILKSFIGKLYKVTAAREGVRFEVNVKDKDAGKRFLQDMISRIDARLRKQVAERAGVIYESMEALYKEAGPTTVLSDTVKQLITSSYTYRQGTVPILIPVSEPEVFLEPQNRTTIAVVSVISAAFLGLLLAFILEAFEKVRKDPDTMARIREAWGGK